MRLSPVASLLVLFGLALPVQAQPIVPAESASHDLITDAVRQVAGRFARDNENYNVEIGNRSFVLHRLENGSRLLARAATKRQPSLQVLNRYNEKQAITTRAV